MGSQYPCSECNKSFARDQYLQRHMAVDHRTKENPSVIYGKTFEDIDQGTEPIKEVHGLEFCETRKIGVFSCNECDYSTPKKINLDRHMMSKHRIPSSVPKESKIGGKAKGNVKEQMSQNISDTPSTKRFFCP